jgi:hypothetical protein
MWAIKQFNIENNLIEITNKYHGNFFLKRVLTNIILI